MDKTFALYGCGKAGLSVALALKSQGYTIIGCDSRSEESRDWGAQWLACPKIKIPQELPPKIPLMIGVSENAIFDVDAAIGEAKYVSERVVFHLSGALPSRALNRCRLTGAKVGSLHPLMILPDPLTGAKNLRNATFAIEGREQAVETLKKMATAISGKFFIVPVKGKTLYHISAVFAANYLVTLLAESEALLEKAGVSHSDSLRAFQSLVEMTVKNYFSEGPIQSLTGPVERGDLNMIKNHLLALSKLPEAKKLYKILAQNTLVLARQKHPERKEIYDELEKLII
ncbi:MAG: Rossmann-like and DUF2520 domain-containing protein [Acidobacteriota bacterium]|nr:DUF2520 domain-containing protein [Thermoanaerobaculaceae bacterium]